MPEPETKELEKENLIGFLKGLEKENFSIVEIDPPYKRSRISKIRHRHCVIKASDLESQLKSGETTPSNVYLDNPKKGLVYIKAPQPGHWGNYKVSVAIYDTDALRTRKYAPLLKVIPENLMEFLEIPELG